MTILAVGAAKGAPGVTTTVLALASQWPAHREPVVIEADPAGGDLVARLAVLTGETGGVTETPSTVQLAAASRSGVTARLLLEHLQRLPGPGELRALVAPPGPFAAATALAALTAAGLGQSLAEQTAFDALLDLGRLDPGSPALELAAGADQFVVVVRPTLESVLHTRDLLTSLAALAARTQVVVIGDRPYTPAEVAEAVAAAGLAGVLPDDAVGATALAGQARSPKVLARTRLIRAATDISGLLAPRPAPPPPPFADSHRGMEAEPAGASEGLSRLAEVSP